MWEIVEEPLDISVEHMVVPLLMEFQDFAHGHVAIAVWPEAIRVIVKQPLKERTQEEAYHILGNPIANGGHIPSALPHLPNSLRDS
jgi:hypothetical protein